MHSKEKDEACLSFLVNIFTKSVHRGGVRGLLLKGLLLKGLFLKGLLLKTNDLMKIKKRKSEHLKKNSASQ